MSNTSFYILSTWQVVYGFQLFSLVSIRLTMYIQKRVGPRQVEYTDLQSLGSVSTTVIKSGSKPTREGQANAILRMRGGKSELARGPGLYVVMA